MEAEEIQEAAHQTAEADNIALARLAEAHGALIRALQAMPNSVHSVFSLPRDVADLGSAQLMVQAVIANAEDAARERDSKLADAHGGETPEVHEPGAGRRVASKPPGRWRNG